MNRNLRLTIRLSEQELEQLKRWGASLGEDSLSALARECIRQFCVRQTAELCPTNVRQMSDKSQEKEQTKESSKEKRIEKEPAGGVVPASAHPPAYEENLILWLTDDEALKPLAAEFLRGLTSRGIDLQQKGLDDLRRHFLSWLPKFRAKQAIAQKQVDNSRTAEQNWVKARREQQAAELQRKLDADCAASANAGAAKKAFFDKFYKYKKHQ